MSVPNWDFYANQIIHKYDFKTHHEVLVENMCTDAAIYGFDGACWTYTANAPELLKYDCTVEGMCEAENVTVNIDELEIAKTVGEGERPKGPAGVRLGKKKYGYVAHDEYSKVTMLSCLGGGAAVANLKSGTIIAFFDKNKSDSTG